MERTLMTMLRIAFAMCFVGHGAFGILRKPDWVPFFALFGIGESWAHWLMPAVGTVDIAIGIAGLVLPIRAVFAYGAFWCLFTAALRPLAGLGVPEFLERAGNYGIPVAVLAVSVGRSWWARVPSEVARRAWPTVYTVAVWTTATLLVGHGWLALQSKPLLVTHLSILGLGPNGAPLLGVFELMLAVTCVLRPSLGLFTFIAAWKVGSEALFIAAGAPIWEFIERGGSYVAPMLAACLAPGVPAPVWSRPLARATAVALIGVLVASPASAQPALLDQLRQGGLVVVCRHAITDRSRPDRSPVDLEDPATQRVLSASGETQAKALGEEWRTLDIRFHTVVSSPYDRARRTAELAAVGPVTIDRAVSMSAGSRADQLKRLMYGPVEAGSNRLVMTHQGPIYRSFPTVKEGSVAEGACVVVRPQGDAGQVLAVVAPGQWGGVR